MAVYDNTYSRVVAWLKIILPLLALAILSTLFLLARTIDPAQNIPFADVDIDELAREQRIGNPNYSGVTNDGAAVSLSAKLARPDPDASGRLIGTDVDAGIVLRDGITIDIVAQTVILDNTKRLAGLRGGVVLNSSLGFQLYTENLDVALGTTRVASDTEIRVTTDFGTLTAGKFVLTGDGSKEKPYLLVFKDRVRLLYVPSD